MHGLINRTIQSFVSDTYGDAVWARIGLAADLGFADFEAMLIYEDALTFRALDAVSCDLGKPRDEVLEDIGTYLVSHPNVEAVRRLLRFGGDDFVEFLHSLDDLPDWARLAVSDLDLPQLDLREHAPDRFTLTVNARRAGYGHVLIGVLRTLADDYGALVLLDHNGGDGGREVITITLVEAGFAEGRDFELGAGSAVVAERRSAMSGKSAAARGRAA
ncbi:heme NO-binding domain-containing protein [Rhodobacteraceae bacterium D3-12]|nr:heme NO-binding domain-containing protein [Rhodobacteraceae bacterium D3-12]